MAKKKIKNKNAPNANLLAFGDWLKKNDKGAAAGMNALSGATGLLAGGNTTGAGNLMQTIGGAASAIPGIGGMIGAGVGVMGGLANAAFGSNVNQQAIGGIESAINQQSGGVSGATTNAALMSDMSSFSNLGNVSKSDIGTEGWFSNKATDKAGQLNKAIADANQRQLMGFSNTAGNIQNTQNMNMLANYKAAGGSLNTPNFDNGVNAINNGGTHEQNPNQGVPMGVDSNGKPNLVEEGEVKFNDYIFSNRTQPNATLLKNIGLGDKHTGSFADVAKTISKESEERPNDPISKRGLDSSMGKLQSLQEMTKQKQQPNVFANGGGLFGGAKSFDTGVSFEPTNTYDKNYLTGNIERNVNNPFNIPDTLGSTPAVYERKLADTVPSLGDIKTQSQGDSSKGFQWDSSYLRYAPVVGSALNVATDLFGKTNKPDYSSANLVAGAGQDVAFKPLGGYMTYNPFDRDYYTNKLSAQSGATRRALRESSGGNRATYAAGLLGADYGAQNQLGNLARQAQESNLAQRQRVSEFNRGTNRANAEGFLRAGMFNTQQDLSRTNQVARLRDLADMRSSAGRSANLTNLFSNIGGIGTEAFNRNMIASNPALMYDLSGTGKVKYKKTKK